MSFQVFRVCACVQTPSLALLGYLDPVSHSRIYDSPEGTVTTSCALSHHQSHHTLSTLNSNDRARTVVGRRDSPILDLDFSAGAWKHRTLTRPAAKRTIALRASQSPPEVRQTRPLGPGGLALARCLKNTKGRKMTNRLIYCMSATPFLSTRDRPQCCPPSPFNTPTDYY